MFLTLLVSASTNAGGQSDVSPDAVLKAVETDGAKTTVAKLTQGHRPQWGAVLKKIGTGDAHWLAVAGGLAAGTDAGTSGDLLVMLAKALPKNPAGVLRLADSQSFLAIDDLCGAPFIEPEPAYLRRYLAQAQRALKRLNEPSVDAQRVKCLSQIEKTMAAVAVTP